MTSLGWIGAFQPQSAPILPSSSTSVRRSASLSRCAIAASCSRTRASALVSSWLPAGLSRRAWDRRSCGLGARIMAQAENEARRRGCTAAFVCTVTFQAPGFYEKYGYRRFGEIACPPDGATRIFLTKTLD